MIHLDIDLITLAYLYLVRKARTTHKKYTIVDVMWTAEMILTRSEHKGGGKKKDLLHFVDYETRFDEKIIE
jgi:hypothetical protein